jgi:hypothetical protein
MDRTEREASESNGMRAKAGGIAILLGLIVVILSFLPVGPMASHGSWSQQQAQAYQAASATLHELSNKYASEAMAGDTRSTRAEVERAKARFDEFKTQLETAQNRPRLVAWAMRLGGALLAAVGAFVIHGQPARTAVRSR